MGERDQDYVRASYDAAVAYADTWLGLLLAELEQRHLLDQLVVVVVSDHGECLGEDGLFCHNLILNQATTRVPLLIRPPGGLPGGRHVDGTAALLDVLPTVLELADIPAPASIQGRSLVPYIQGDLPAPDDLVFTEGQFRTIAANSSRGQLVFSGIGANDPLLPSLLEAASVDSPSFAGTTIPRPEEREQLRDAMLAWRDELRPAEVSTAPPDPELLDALQEHGYWRAE
jgi:hypothetical protein